MKRVVIESPYAGEVDLNVAYAKACVLDSLSRGEAPYASHLFFTLPGILDDDKPDERTKGIEAGFAWGEAADLVAVYIDRGVSQGMIAGIDRAVRAMKPITLRSVRAKLDMGATWGSVTGRSCDTVEDVTARAVASARQFHELLEQGERVKKGSTP